MTFGDVVEQAIVLIRKHNTLKDWTDDQIRKYAAKSFNENAFAANFDSEGNLIGVVFGGWKDETCLHVSCLVAPKQLKLFFKYLKTNYPKCKMLTAYRNNQFTIYNLK